MDDAEREQVWLEWLNSRPSHVRRVASRFRPWLKYRLTTTGQIVTVHSFLEGKRKPKRITLKVTVLFADNPQNEGRRAAHGGAEGFHVFGIKPEDLEPLQ